MNSQVNINLLRQSFRSKEYQSWLTQCARQKVGSLTEEALLSEIEKHKWLLSEKLNRDVDRILSEIPIDSILSIRKLGDTFSDKVGIFSCRLTTEI